MRRIFQNLIAAILGGLIWTGYTYLQLRSMYVLTWQVLGVVAITGFCLVMLSTSIVGLFIKEPKHNSHLEVEILKAGEN